MKIDPGQTDCASLFRLAGKKCVHHATTAARLPDIVASGGLLNSRRLGESSERWGANSKLGRELVCCGFCVPWFLFKQFGGEESVVLSFDAAALSALPRVIFSPYNTGRPDAAKYLERKVDQRSALMECLEAKSPRNLPELLAPTIPLSALRFVVFCDEEARQAWAPVVETAMGGTVPESVSILVDGKLDQVRFPPGLRVNKRLRPLPRGINRRGDLEIADSPEPLDPSSTPQEVSGDFWTISETVDAADLLDSLIDWMQGQGSEKTIVKRGVGQERWVNARKKVEERAKQSGLAGLKQYIQERENDDQLIPYRLEGRKYLFEQEGQVTDLIALAAEYRRAANELSQGPDVIGRDECLTESLKIYRKALKTTDSSNNWSYALVGVAAVLADIGNFDKAFEFCSLVLAEFPNDRAAQNVLERVEAPWR